MQPVGVVVRRQGNGILLKRLLRQLYSNRVMQEPRPMSSGKGRAGEVRQLISARKGKNLGWQGMSVNKHLCVCPPCLSQPLLASPFFHVTSQTSVLPTFSWDWNVQTFSHGLPSGLTETRWLLNQTHFNGTHSNRWVGPRGKDAFKWTLGMMGVSPLSHTLGEASLLSSRCQSRADHNKH